MKHEKWISRLIALAMTFGLAYAGICCVITGYDLNVNQDAVALNVLIAAAIITMIGSYRWGNLILVALIALFVNHLWYRGDLEKSLEGLVYQISCSLDSAYHWGVAFWSKEPPVHAQLETVLSLLGVPVIWVTAWTVLRRKPALLAVPVAALLPAICFVITGSVPDTWCLFLVCLILLLLMLTQLVRRRDPAEANRLVALLLIPALLCTSLLFWAVPADGKLPQINVPQWMQDLLTGNGYYGGGADMGEMSDLSQLGPKWEARTEVMQIKSSRTGVIYLRGQTFDHYDKTAWKVSDVDLSQDKYWPTRNMVADGRITVTYKSENTVRYVPYYPRSSEWLSQIKDGRMQGEETTSYSFLTITSVGGNNLATSVSRDAVVSQCLQLPDSTAEQAKEIVKSLEILPTYSDWKKAQIIGEYVRNLREYDTKTGVMPSNRDDFALWFLTEAETGYCVHFATAATVLLRAAGVPARYVTGYMVETKSGFAIVEERHAHAWVEYLDSERGWTVLEATPASAFPSPTEPTVTEPTESSVTTEPTEVTDPSESTQMTQPPQTDPTISTEPSESTIPQNTVVVTPGVEKDWGWLWDALKYTALALSGLGLIAGQYYLRMALRTRKRRKGTVNQRALADWKEVLRLSRLLKQSVSEELEELAEKANVSQHTLTVEERTLFHMELARLQNILNSKNLVWRILLKLVFALK